MLPKVLCVCKSNLSIRHMKWTKEISRLWCPPPADLPAGFLSVKGVYILVLPFLRALVLAFFSYVFTGLLLYSNFPVSPLVIWQVFCPSVRGVSQTYSRYSHWGMKLPLHPLRGLQRCHTVEKIRLAVRRGNT